MGSPKDVELLGLDWDKNTSSKQIWCFLIKIQASDEIIPKVRTQYDALLDEEEIENSSNSLLGWTTRSGGYVARIISSRSR